MIKKTRILVAGIGGGSLGTEVIKSLQKSGHYVIFGCDISEFAFGHYQSKIEDSFLIDRNNYVGDICRICRENKIHAIVPGGEEPSILLSEVQKELNAIDIYLVSNTSEVISLCSDKDKLFKRLRKLNLPIPQSISPKQSDDMNKISCPCVVKPAIGSGGSNFVFLATDKTEATLYVDYLLRHNKLPIVQEYIPLDEGEFTIGILHLPDGTFVGSIALKRMFNAKLSVMTRTNAGLISSGYSQGLIDDFPEVRKQAELIAYLLGSRGPLNIQGRMKNGTFLPFEINPRFSATTYLRSMAGFNEIDIYLQYVLNGHMPYSKNIRYGFYFRSLEEVFVEKKNLKK